MVDSAKRTWAVDLMQRLDLPVHLPAPIVEPGLNRRNSVARCCSPLRSRRNPGDRSGMSRHGSAVAAISAREGTAFLSSGTWSLLGTELDSPVITSDALRLNFTNEGGVNGTTRLLKNVMGLWMLQCCRACVDLTRAVLRLSRVDGTGSSRTCFRHLVDPDDESFLRPPTC